MIPNRPAWRSKRPAPRMAAGAPKPITDDVTWTREIEPRERYRIHYVDGKGELTEREIELMRLGDMDGTPYLGVFHLGRFKTLRADRVTMVEQISTGHPPSIFAAPTYRTELPHFPVENAVYKMPTTRAGSKTWTVDLNQYTCRCPEQRIRLALGYSPGQLGYVCPHMARAILDHLPAVHSGHWSPELLRFLSDPRRVHIDNLV